MFAFYVTEHLSSVMILKFISQQIVSYSSDDAVVTFCFTCNLFVSLMRAICVLLPIGIFFLVSEETFIL